MPCDVITHSGGRSKYFEKTDGRTRYLERSFFGHKQKESEYLGSPCEHDAISMSLTGRITHVNECDMSDEYPCGYELPFYFNGDGTTSLKRQATGPDITFVLRLKIFSERLSLF
jgi:hypothetical protein